MATGLEYWPTTIGNHYTNAYGREAVGMQHQVEICYFSPVAYHFLPKLLKGKFR